jgi:hypothetical protein
MAIPAADVQEPSAFDAINGHEEELEEAVQLNSNVGFTNKLYEHTRRCKAAPAHGVLSTFNISFRSICYYKFSSAPLGRPVQFTFMYLTMQLELPGQKLNHSVPQLPPRA